jgi:hypothetical protein
LIGTLPLVGAPSPRLLPVAAVLTFAVSTALVVLAGASAGTLGHDYLAYDAAARRLLAGRPLYDTSVEAAGGFGLYFYPPPFAVAVLPLAATVSADLAVWLWTGALVAALVAGIAFLPVGRTTRWLVLGLAGISWPVVYSIKLGQVGPLLVLLFALGWRGLASDRVVGLVAALGGLVKIQPLLLLGWAILRRRWGAVGLGAAVLGVLAAAATPVVGAGAWPDFVSLLTRVSDPITTPGNVTVGAVLYRAGVARDVAATVQWLTVGLVGLAWLVATLRRPTVVGYLATVVVSQLVSPILWDHYATLALLPVAYLADRGWSWAILVPLATPWLLAGQIPAVMYPVLFTLVLGALLAVPEAAVTPPREVGAAVAVPSEPGSEGSDVVASIR